VSGFCGDSLCSLRIQVWFMDPEDEQIGDPCPPCLDALAAVLGVTTDGPPTLIALCAATEDRRSS
jgi:hypothetical protein